MPRRREPARVLGPYEENGKWRVIVVENRRRVNHFAEDRQAAQRMRARLRREVNRRAKQRSLGDVLEQWREARLMLAKCRPETIEHQHQRILAMLADDLDKPIDALTEKRAIKLYAQHIERPCRTGRPLAVASQHFDVCITRELFKWAVRQGLIERNPFAAVKLVGRVRSGKVQLRITEARAFSDAAMVLYEETGLPLLVGALLALWLGLRSGEVLGARVRDVDDGARVLWIERGKTRNARRHLLVPEPLRPALLGLIADRAPNELLFASEGGAAFHRSSLGRAVWNICDRARVPRVCVHALRGTHATLAIDAGASAAAVAAALGHASFAVTARHYAEPDAVSGAQLRRTVAALEGAMNRSGIDPTP